MFEVKTLRYVDLKNIRDYLQENGFPEINRYLSIAGNYGQDSYNYLVAYLEKWS